MKIEITNRFTGTVMFGGEFPTIAACLLAAVAVGTNLYGANLSGANLSGAVLYGANLYGANLYGANLSDANLSGANLSGADLHGANLSGTNLYGANLSGANLYGANLSDANLSGANLYGANLREAKEVELVIAQTRILPEGALIGWKKCKGGVVVKLSIPAEAKRSNAFGRKCRAEFVDVLDVIGGDVGKSIHDGGKTEYRKGERVTANSFDDNWQDECSNGIHFFITQAEAVAYNG